VHSSKGRLQELPRGRADFLPRGDFVALKHMPLQ